MKIRPTHLCVLIAMALSLAVSCDDDETYADLREREDKQIRSFLHTGCQVASKDGNGNYLLNVPGNIKVISEDEFYRNDSTTDVSKNEYVYFGGSGVYMQIVRKGPGEKIKEGETVKVLSRYTEFNIAADSIISSNNKTIIYDALPEAMMCQNNFGVITASFKSGLMHQLYKSAAVPSGWIIPMHFVNIGRQDSPDGEIALVRVIVPSSQGQSDAQYRVYPCFYEISYQRERK